MLPQSRRFGGIALRLIVGLALLGCARVSRAQGMWSVVSLPLQPSQVVSPWALAADAAGNLYVADEGVYPNFISRIQKRDAQGNWSVIATEGSAPGQVLGGVDRLRLAADPAGNLYVADGYPYDRIQKRDADGSWTIIATSGTDPGHVVFDVGGLAADAAGNLYVGDWAHGIQKRDPQGNWSVIDSLYGGVPRSLAVDAAGNLYVAVQVPWSTSSIQKRDAQGNWSVIDYFSGIVAADSASDLYVAVVDQILRWEVKGNWSVIATEGDALGQVFGPSGLAVDAAGNLYVADTGNNRMLKYTPQH